MESHGYSPHKTLHFVLKVPVQGIPYTYLIAMRKFPRHWQFYGTSCECTNFMPRLELHKITHKLLPRVKAAHVDDGRDGQLSQLEMFWVVCSHVRLVQLQV